MFWLFHFIARHRNFFSLILTVFLSVGMLVSPADRQNSISRALLMSVFYPLQFTLKQVTTIRNIFVENKILRDEITELSLRVARLKEYETENSRLREMLEVADHFSYELVPSRVIVREPSSSLRSIVIDAGAGNGIVRYAPVINKDGVVGKAIQVLPHLTLVQLIRDPACRTGVMIQRSRVVGILETDQGISFSIKLRKHGDVATGDTVITSGLGGVFPKGLIIGTVSDIDEEYQPLFKRVRVEPSVHFHRLEEVYVMKLEPRWSAFREEIDSLRLETW